MAQAGQVHMRRQALVAKPTHGHKERKMLLPLMWLVGLLLSWVATAPITLASINIISVHPVNIINH
jgi:hypothetical protein